MHDNQSAKYSTPMEFADEKSKGLRPNNVPVDNV